MPKFEITPAHSPDILCEFVIPRKTGKPIEFTVPRMEYTSPQGNAKFDEWLLTRMLPVPVLDDQGNPVREDGSPKTTPASAITDREVSLKMLECAGVSAATLDKLASLTNGEIEEIYKHWQDASKVTPGESDASENS